jgi:hypothetical protein
MFLLSLCIINYELCHEDVRSGCIAPLFLNSALDGGEWSSSRPGHFTSRGNRPPGTHWTGGWVDRSGCCREEKILPLPGLEPRPSSL